MSSLTIRNIAPDVKQRLRSLAASHGRSMEEEARLALAAHVPKTGGNDYDALRAVVDPTEYAQQDSLPGVGLREPESDPEALGSRWSEFIRSSVAAGRYHSAEEVIREGLRLVEEREFKLRNLRHRLQSATDDDVWFTWEETEQHVKAQLRTPEE